MEVTKFAFLIPVIAIVFGCGIAIIAIVLEYFQKKKYYESLVKALEMGKDPEQIKAMFGEPEEAKKNEPGRYLRRGIITIGVGVGLALIGWLNANTWLVAIGCFLGVLGLSFLIVHFLLNKNKQSE
ncbi:hypothetical protein A2Y85_01895 [candidate division WOR-3 bacterium RBG_13_43_14]|uniref:DUF6249 domain-containing protein n=1 Tax=candidate division WOR-3 bacterium RBG_13_43_14 TaxID=1802590 RepID=A0A1F4UH44_UNCW3|nr:MAG: hypothetical protein A2Y85_01895 [candidate division WOR-3 bacterium RBG_13_43_14]